MIRKIKFKNFYSFKEENEINFLAKKKASYSYFHSKTDDYITKIATFIGSNASGKTNVMRLFSFLGYFICTGSKRDSVLTNNVGFKTYFSNSEPSTFEVEFEDKDRIFYYSLTVVDNTVMEEDLAVKKIEKHAKKVKVFTRKRDNIETLNINFFKDFSKKFIKNIRLDVSLVGFLKAHYNIEIINDIYEYFHNLKTNVNERGYKNTPYHKFETYELYVDDKELKNSMEDFVRNFDLGLEGFKIEKKDEKDIRSISLTGLHTTEDGEKELDYEYESQGTKSLLLLYANIITALRNNSIVIVDEIEEGIHPEALNKLISYIIDENAETKAQIIFSSHSLEFMNKLDMHQIFLTEKDGNGKSNVYRLNEVEGIRSDENFLRKYMSGAYGAFPKIRI